MRLKIGLLLLGHNWPKQQTVQEGFRTRAMSNSGVEEFTECNFFLLFFIDTRTKGMKLS